MKNILNQKPTINTAGRVKYSLEYVNKSDIFNKTILDIGCGFGWSEINFLKRRAKSICAIEISEIDLLAAKSNIKDSRVEFKVGSAIKIPYPDNYFDTIVSWEVLEHIPKDTELLMYSEVSRVLKKGGIFYLSTPFKHFITNILDPAWWMIGHRHYSKRQLAFFGEKNGLAMTDFNVRAGFWTIASLLNLYILKWVFRRKRFAERFFMEKENEEYFSENKGIFNIFAKYQKK